jgi:cytoskeletal protein CcmA (bactofilin family)
MFGRKDSDEPQAHIDEPAITIMPASPRMASPAISPRPAPLARRVASVADDRNGAAERKLTVGKGLSLAGEITSCDVLVVEGKVEAKLTDGKMLEITECGQFRGSVEIENADIAGRYDGQLVVHGRLTVRSTGRISGTVKYGELEVNAGGQIIGEIQVAGGGTQAQQGGGNNFRSAAKFASTEQEEERRSERSERKSA